MRQQLTPAQPALRYSNDPPGKPGAQKGNDHSEPLVSSPKTITNGVLHEPRQYQAVSGSSCKAEVNEGLDSFRECERICCHYR